MNGIFVAMTVMNGTFASSGRLAMYTTASATCFSSISGSCTVAPIGLQGAGGGAAGHDAGVADIDLAAGDVPGAAIERNGPGEPGDGVLGGRVGCGVGPGHMGGDGAVVDDAATLRLLRFHEPESLLGAEKGAGQVHVYDVGPLLVREVFKRDAGDVDAGVVEQHVEAAVAVVDRGKKGIDRSGLAYVGRERQGVGAVGHCGGQFEFREAAAGERKGIAGGGHGQGDGAADATAGSGDEGYLGLGVQGVPFKRRLVVILSGGMGSHGLAGAAKQRATYCAENWRRVTRVSYIQTALV